MRKKYYVGMVKNYNCCNPIDKKFKVFMSDFIPNYKSHGSIYKYVIGPFRTKIAALVMAKYGHNNPHMNTVDDVEKLIKVYDFDI